MAAARTKRVLFLLTLLFAVVIVGVLVFAFMISRDIPYDWDHPNSIEASEARRKLKLYETSLESGQRGFVRFSELEINSYLASVLSPTNKSTNAVEAEMAGPVKLRKAAVGLTSTNIILFSWGQARPLGLPLNFVLQRGLRLNQTGTNAWSVSTEFMKIGELEIERKYWPRLETYVSALDKPLLKELTWTTNIQAIIGIKSDMNQRPELRLYTFKPIPSDVR
jgi:hypothetical protein